MSLIVMVGLPCSGKTTFAKALAEQRGAIRLTPDDWQLRLFGDDFDLANPFNSYEAHNARHDEIERIMLELARKLLPKGIDVILDFGFWGKSERDEMRNMAAECHTDFEMYVMDTPLEILYQRVENRKDSYNITKADIDVWLGWYQVPEPNEAGAIFIQPRD